MPPLSPTDWQHRTDAALAWLRRSIAATGGRGSAHSWSPLFGWAGAYPETTGYLIETLFDFAALKNDESLRRLAFDCAGWLTEIQMPNGAFPAGKIKDYGPSQVVHRKSSIASRQPSVFNTSQILFGLQKTVKEILAEENDLKLLQTALHRAVDWLLSLLEPDGAWRQAAYVPGFVPSYYTRAIWGVLVANQVLRQPEIEEKMRLALHFYARRFLPNGAVREWGFRPDRAAFTHTIAYTLEGFWESALFLGERDIVERTLASAEKLWAVRQQNGRTAGAYDENWRGNHSFLCVTGNAQLSVLFSRLFALTGAPEFRVAAGEFLAEILDSQNFGKNPNAYGGLPGSIPFWGPYMRGRVPNWGVKFFLDALAAQDLSPSVGLSSLLRQF